MVVPASVSAPNAWRRGDWGWYPVDKASTGEKLVLGSGGILFILSFIGPWAKLDVGELGALAGDTSFSAWDYAFFPLKLGIIISLIGVGLVVAKLAGANLDLPPATHAAIGGLTLLLVLLALLMGPPDVPFFDVIDRGFMLFLAVIPAAAQACGGYMTLQEQGGTITGPATPPPPTA